MKHQIKSSFPKYNSLIFIKPSSGETEDLPLCQEDYSLHTSEKLKYILVNIPYISNIFQSLSFTS